MPPQGDRLRVLILNERDPRHPRAGGAELHVAEIFRRLAERGHEITWTTCRGEGTSAGERLDGMRIERLAPIPFYYARAAWGCARRTRDDEFDVVVDCLNKVPFLSPLYSAKPVLAIAHHLFGSTAFQQVAWPIAAAVVLFEKWIPFAYRRTPFVTISESSRDDLVERGVARERVEVSLCGIDRPDGPIDVETRRGPVVSYLGRLEAYKRVDVFLRACAALVPRHPDLEILVIGRGTAEESLRELASELGLHERVRFTGFVSNDERDAMLGRCRVCVCPSEKEGWGLTVIEANAYGTPVVASDAPGLRESVRHGETGLLVPIGDDAACAEAMEGLLTDDDTWARVAAAALEWSKHFDWDRCADDTERALLRAAGDRT